MIFQKTFRSLGLFSLCLLLSTSSLLAFPPATDPGGDPGYTGEQLLRGIFFAQGPVADRIAILQKIDLNRFIKDADTRQQILDFQDQIVAKINADHPTYLQDLQEVIASGNSYRIQRILEEGNTMVSNIAVDLRETEKLRQQLIATQVDRSQTATAEEKELTSKAIAQHLWDLLPVCLLRHCIPPDKVVVLVQNLDVSDVELFQEKLISEVANL